MTPQNTRTHDEVLSNNRTTEAVYAYGELLFSALHNSHLIIISNLGRPEPGESVVRVSDVVQNPLRL